VTGLVAEGLDYRVGAQPLLTGLSLRVEPGQVHALLGPNGAGKSTLLRLLAGDLLPAQGTITLNGRALADWSARERAQQRAVLPQAETLRFAFTVAQVVSLGRLPCARHREARERAIVEEALSAVDASPLAQRRYPSLSGGERQRVQLARVLAQVWEPVDLGPRYLLLDEPTASLDLAHQHRCLRLARNFAAQGLGVLAVLHDPNLALAYADRITLLADGACAAQGTPLEVLTPPMLERVYGVHAELLHDNSAVRAPYLRISP
jgi:iron complex transport system ATP-binding protein